MIRTQTRYWAECDKCGAPLTIYHDSVEDVERVTEGKNLCRVCSRKKEKNNDRTRNC